MSVLSSSIDSQFLFIALEDGSANQLIKRLQISTEMFTTAFEPGAGSASNILQHPTDENFVYFYGQFGASVNVIKHTISSVTNTDISIPITNVINSLAVNPSDDQQLYAYANSNQSLYFTLDGGANWTVDNGAVGLSAVTQIITLWSTPPSPNRLFASGDDTVNAIINYTPNGGISGINLRSGALASQVSALGFTSND